MGAVWELDCAESAAAFSFDSNARLLSLDKDLREEHENDFLPPHDAPAFLRLPALTAWKFRRI